MSRWFRFYAEAMRNPKVARLSDKEFRLWVELLAVVRIPPRDFTTVWPGPPPL